MHHADFADRLLEGIDAALAPLDRNMIDGKPADWTQYQGMVGQAAGLRRVRKMIVDALAEDEKRQQRPPFAVGE